MCQASSVQVLTMHIAPLWSHQAYAVISNGLLSPVRIQHLCLPYCSILTVLVVWGASNVGSRHCLVVLMGLRVADQSVLDCKHLACCLVLRTCHAVHGNGGSLGRRPSITTVSCRHVCRLVGLKLVAVPVAFMGLIHGLGLGLLTEWL